MKRILWLAMICLSVASLTAAKEPTPAATEAGMPAGLAERAAAYGAAMAKRDVAALDDIWADDYTFINPHGDLLTKKQRLENIKSGTTAVEATARQSEAVHVYGDTVLTASRCSRAATALCSAARPRASAGSSARRGGGGVIAAQRREGPAASRPFQRYGCLAQRKPTLTRDLDGASMARKA